VVVCRTGYTGERGYELIASNDVAAPLWDALMAAGEEHGMLACGLGARDTLRTEMGYPLHGQRDVLLKEKEEGAKRILRGIVSTSRAIPRPGMRVSLTPDVTLGEVTSGTFSPTLKKGVGLALISTVAAPDAEVGVDVRGRREIFQLTPPPFVEPSVRES
jgi:aminomethyltransferase